jgi:D-alanyl-D-alanine endopeptidase (penicillin-binding protein 7)
VVLKSFRYALVLMAWLGAVATGADSTPSAQVLAPDRLQLASVHALVLDLDSGKTLYAKRSETPVPIASVTKLMTAMVVLDGKQPLEEWLTIVDWGRDTGKNAYSRLRIGSQARRGELLRIALMSSENLATHVLAYHYPGGVEAFVAAMNAKAEALGMTRTWFVDPAGISPNNQSTAGDLGKMVRNALTYDRIRDYSTGYQRVVQFRKPRYTLGYGNTNPLVASSRWNLALSKTGYLNEAGRCLAMITEIDSDPVAIVLLNSFGKRTPLGDAGRVRRWLTTGDGGKVAAPALEYERRMGGLLEAGDI